MEVGKHPFLEFFEVYGQLDLVDLWSPAIVCFMFHRDHTHVQGLWGIKSFILFHVKKQHWEWLLWWELVKKQHWEWQLWWELVIHWFKPPIYVLIYPNLFLSINLKGILHTFINHVVEKKLASGLYVASSPDKIHSWVAVLHVKNVWHSYKMQWDGLYASK